MKVLGLDPGTHRVGWGVIEGNALKQSLLASGCLELPPHTELGVYLQAIYANTKNLLDTYKPDLVAIEKLFFQKNLKTAISVAQARGVMLLAISELDYSVVELSPNTIKSAVTGNGAADKKDVARMVGLLLGSQKERLDDTSDALGAAISALVMNKI